MFENIRDEKFVEQRQKEVDGLLATMTHAEKVEVLFVPHVIYSIIWSYVDKVIDYCATNKIATFQKLTRKVREYRSSWNRATMYGADFEYLQRINEKAKEIMKALEADMVILWYCVNNEILKKYPNDPYIEMRTNAHLALLFINFLSLHSVKEEEILDAHGMFQTSERYRDTKIVYRTLSLYTIGTELEFNEHFRVFLKSFDSLMHLVDIDSNILYYYYENGKKGNVRRN